MQRRRALAQTQSFLEKLELLEIKVTGVGRIEDMKLLPYQTYTAKAVATTNTASTFDEVAALKAALAVDQVAALMAVLAALGVVQTGAALAV